MFSYGWGGHYTIVTHHVCLYTDNPVATADGDCGWSLPNYTLLDQTTYSMEIGASLTGYLRRINIESNFRPIDALINVPLTPTIFLCRYNDQPKLFPGRIDPGGCDAFNLTPTPRYGSQTPLISVL